jgi:hypothetical protein
MSSSTRVLTVSGKRMVVDSEFVLYLQRRLETTVEGVAHILGLTKRELRTYAYKREPMDSKVAVRLSNRIRQELAQKRSA